MQLFGRSVVTGLGIGLGLLVIGATALCGIGAANDVSTSSSHTAVAGQTATRIAIERTVVQGLQPTWQAREAEQTATTGVLNLTLTAIETAYPRTRPR